MITTIIALTLAQSTAVDFAKILDLDGDGIVHPMEAADAIQMMYDDPSTGLPVNEVNDVIEEYAQFNMEESVSLIEEFDDDGDGVIQFEELPEDLVEIASFIDTDNTNSISLDEFLKLEYGFDDLYIRVEIKQIFEEFNESDSISFDTLERDDPDFAEMLASFDTNNDDRISKKEMFQCFLQFDIPASFEVDGDRAEMTGTIGPSTPFRIMELVFYHPEVSTIVMSDVPGSLDDDSNLRACRMVRAHGLNTFVPRDGEVASGGTDFFQAGVERTCEKGAKFGVHSWAEFGAEGTDYPRDSEEHVMYLNYYDEMGIPQSFYWYTLEAASAEDIHWMTESELEQYNMFTSPIKE